MNIQNLTGEALEKLYETEMKEAFPPAELKPLHRLQSMVKNGEYQVLAYYEKNIFLAYACFYTAAEPALLDYYAVRKAYRGRGVGSRFLQALSADESFSQGFLAEAEDPDYAQDEMALMERKRRIAFYRHNGFQDSGMRAEIFGVRYRILTSAKVSSSVSVVTALKRCYDGMVPLDLPRRHERIKINSD